MNTSTIQPGDMSYDAAEQADQPHPDLLHKQRAADYEAEQERRAEYRKARARQRMEQQPQHVPGDARGTRNAVHGPSEASVDRLVRSSRIMYGNQPTEDQVRAWAADQTQRAVSDRISAIEDMPGFTAKRIASNPRKQPAQGGKLNEVPEGRYAVHHDGQLRFFKVDKPTEGRWAGYTFMKEGVGGAHGDLVWHRMTRDRREAAAAAIMEVAPQQAAQRFGQEVGECGVCGRSLTDEESRNYGIGPVCRGKTGW